MYVLIWLACAPKPEQGPAPTPSPPEPSEAPPSAIPEIGEGHTQPARPAPETPIADALQSTPAAISALYVLSLSDDRAKLTVDPRPQATRRARDLPSSGFSTEDSAAGGKIITLGGGPFRSGAWIEAPLADIVTDSARRDLLVRSGYALDTARPMLVVTSEGSPETTTFAFSLDGSKLGIVGICTEVTPVDFGTPSPVQVVRKPVIYLYPERRQEITVDVELAQGAAFSAVYPAMGEHGWSVFANPSGEILDPRTSRRHRYLFWEGSGASFVLTPSRAHLVARGEGAAFLERLCEAYALTDEACGDLVTYWLPEIERSPYARVELLDEPYEAYASLRVDPEPETLIRLFLLVQPLQSRLPAGNPPLPRLRREGYTVIEWGGTVL